MSADPGRIGVFASWTKLLTEADREQTDFVERIPERWIPAAILLASAACLFVEMVMVRWHATCFHGFAIFKNVSLLSCFLGLGIGFGLPKQRPLTLAIFLPLLAIQTALFGVLSTTNLGGRIVNPIAEQNVMGMDAPAGDISTRSRGTRFSSPSSPSTLSCSSRSANSRLAS